MSELVEFLLACFANDEHRLELPEFFEEDSARGPGWGNRGECPICGAHQFSGTEPVTEEAWWEHAEKVHQRTRVLAECEAKRRIVARQPRLSAPDDVRDVWWDLVALLALPYADHPSYDEAWRP